MIFRKWWSFSASHKCALFNTFSITFRKILVLGLLTETFPFKPQRKQSGAVKSGERGIYFLRALVALAVCAVAPSCWDPYLQMVSHG